MSARIKSALLISCWLLILLGGLFWLSRNLVLNEFDRIEADQTRDNVIRVQDAIRDTLASIDSVAGDWANWDDSYEFVQGGNPGFVATNMQVTTYRELHLDMIALVSRSGALRYGRSLDSSQDVFGPLPSPVVELLRPGGALNSFEATGDRIHGLVLAEGRALLVASRPLLTSQGTGPIEGALVFGRYVEEDELERLRAETHLDITAWIADSSDQPSDLLAALATGWQGEEPIVSEVDHELLAGYGVIDDIHGHPALTYRVNQSRTIHAQGRNAVRYLGTAVLGVGLLAGIIAQILVTRLILSRDARRKTEAEYQSLVEQAGEGILVVDAASGRVTQANAAAARLTGIETANVEGLFQRPSPLAEGLSPIVSRVAATGEREEIRLAINRPDGRNVDLEASLSRIHVDGRHDMLVVLRDVTDRTLAEQALRVSEERFALASRGANDGLWDWDLASDKIHFSDRWKNMLGFSGAEISDSPGEWIDRIHPDDRDRFKAALSSHLLGVSHHLEDEHRILHRTGTYRWMLCRGLAVRQGTAPPTRMAGSISDITLRKQAEERLAHDALHDGLTGLPNRNLFLDRLERAMERARRHRDQSFAVLFLDLDRFKVVNDSLGHMAGDSLLLEVGHRLEQATRAEDTVARLGGDEFALLMEDVTEVAAVTRLADRIQAALASPFQVADQEIFTSASIGVALWEIEYRRPEEILRDADIAMYRAKEKGPAHHAVYDSRLHEQAMTQLRLESDLRRALERDELTIFYQPVLQIETGSVRGFEALVRWNHPERGLILPSQFIPLAEETGLIVPLGRWVLAHACEQLHKWQAVQPDLALSVNVSSRQFADPGFLADVETILRQHEIPPGKLQLEITERLIIENPEAALNLMLSLKTLGVVLSLDDFGTGYSSLSYLHRFPIDILKVDRAFISGQQAEAGRPAILGAIVALAHGLDMAVVAEGIETAAQAERVRMLDCEYGQGYWFARPIPADEAGHLLAGESPILFPSPDTQASHP